LNRCPSRVLCIFTLTSVRGIPAMRDSRKGLRTSPRTLEAYARGRHLIAQEYVADGKFEPVIGRLLERQEVDYIQVNSTMAGCYTFRIERQDASVASIG